MKKIEITNQIQKNRIPRESQNMAELKMLQARFDFHQVVSIVFCWSVTKMNLVHALTLITI
jgi:hypothetical protein